MSLLWNVKAVEPARQFVLVVMIAAVGAIATVDVSSAQPRASLVKVAKVQEREVADETPVIGRLVATVDSAIAATTSGVVREVTVKVGDAVKAGDVVARLDTTDYMVDKSAAEAAVRQATAALGVAKARRQRANDELKRSERLRGSTAFSAARVEDLGHALAEAAAAEAVSTAAMATAKAQLQRAERNLVKSTIYSPFAGVVIERQAQPGQYIATGQSAARIVNLAELEVEIDMPSARLQAMRQGVKVKVIIAGVEASGVVRAIVPSEASSTRTRPVRIDVDFTGVDPLLLAPGASATVLAPTSAPRKAVIVPKDALVQGRQGWMVFVAADGKAQPRGVRIGAASGDGVEVLSGVASGELVVIRGNEGLRPGQAIRTGGGRPGGKPGQPGAKQGGAKPGEPAKKGQAPSGGAAGEKPKEDART